MDDEQAARPRATRTEPGFELVRGADAIVVPLADGDLIDTDSPRCRQPRTLDLLLHVELIQLLHGTVVQTLVLPPSSVATPCLNASVSWPACVGERH